MRRTATFLAVLALTGCATAPQVMKMTPPVDLLQDCPHPAVLTGTNGDLARGILAYREALSLCNNDKAALRAWSEN